MIFVLFDLVHLTLLMISLCVCMNLIVYFYYRSLYFHDFVAKCLTKEPRLRPTASEMLKVCKRNCFSYEILYYVKLECWLEDLNYLELQLQVKRC